MKAPSGSGFNKLSGFCDPDALLRPAAGSEVPISAHLSPRGPDGMEGARGRRFLPADSNMKSSSLLVHDPLTLEAIAVSVPPS